MQRCAVCGESFEFRDGIYRFLLPERLAQLQPLIAQYRAIRAKDGYRTFHAPDYYRALPQVDSRDPNAAIWRVRQSSFATLCRQVLPPLKGKLVLDLGAGNGWLCHRLAQLGYDGVALDWLDDADDGLGAWRNYSTNFVCVQADFDALPLAHRQFDLIIFNASLHYAPNALATLERSCRLLLPGGSLAIMDSPTFDADHDGKRMVVETVQRFKADYGLQDALWWGEGYLNTGRVVAAGQNLGFGFRFIRSRGSLWWEIRRWLAGVKNGHKPARFGVWLGRLP